MTTSLWPVPMRRPIAGAGVLGAAGVIAGYAGASGSADPGSQMAWTVLAVCAVAVAGVASAAWVTVGLRAVRLRRTASVRRIDGFLGAVGGAPTAGDVAPAGAPPATVAGQGMTRFHRPDCPLVDGKDVRRLARGARGRGGRRACEICRPDGVV